MHARFRIEGDEQARERAGEDQEDGAPAEAREVDAREHESAVLPIQLREPLGAEVGREKLPG